MEYPSKSQSKIVPSTSPDIPRDALGIIITPNSSQSVHHHDHQIMANNLEYVSRSWMKICSNFITPKPNSSQSDHHDKHQIMINFLCFLILIPVFVIIFCCFLVVALASLPLLLLSLIITRILQFIKYDHDYYSKVTNFKNVIRGWLLIEALMLLVSVWIFYPIAKFVPSLKKITFLDLPITEWIVIITIALSFYFLSYLVYLLIHRLVNIEKIKISLNMVQALAELMESLIFWWSEHQIIKRVPTFKQHEILGLSTGKWIRVSILLVIGYNLITMILHLKVLVLRIICQQTPQVTQKEKLQKVIAQHLDRKYIVYFANGLKKSISFLLCSMLLLVTWVLYFKSRLDMRSYAAKRTWEIGLWTCISLSIYSLLWLIKTYVLLNWKAHTVYQRLESKILNTSKQLYYLGVIGRKQHTSNIFELLDPKNDDADDCKQTDHQPSIVNGDWKMTNVISSAINFSLERATTKLVVRDRETVKNELVNNDDNPTFDYLRRATKYFLQAKPDLSSENYISRIMQNFDSSDHNHNREELEKLIVVHPKQKDHVLLGLTLNLFTHGPTQKYTCSKADKSRNDDVGQPDVQNTCSCISQCNDWKMFLEKLSITESASKFSFGDIQKWVKRAHKECMLLTNTLSNAQEVSDCLNKIISWLLIGATFIGWLLLTRLATTKILVIIASPLFAATFIFGETCKTFFQGFIFIYVVHPYDVGDLCLIDDNMMEVTSIGVWTSRFTKVDKHGNYTNEVMSCPNSEMAYKSIINYKTKFDWSDHVAIGEKPNDVIDQGSNPNGSAVDQDEITEEKKII